MSEQTKKFSTKMLVRCALFAAVICVLAPFSIPIGPIPITLGLFTIMLCAVVLDVKSALISVAVYILLGAVGLPVFSSGKGGFAVLIGPTGGYIWSYLLMVLTIGLMKKISVNVAALRWIIGAVSCVLAIAICYAAGTAQFVMLQKCELGYALSVCVLPFIPFDLGKAAVALILGNQIARRIDGIR